MAPIKKKSKYSDYFDMTIKSKATCLKCGHVIQRSGGSTYGMKSHLKSQHDIVIDPIEIAVEREKPKSGASTSNPSNTLDNFVVKESLEEMVSREATQFGATFRYLSRVFHMTLVSK